MPTQFTDKAQRQAKRSHILPEGHYHKQENTAHTVDKL